MTDTPIPMRWNGEDFVRLNQYWGKQADKLYVVGGIYRLVAVEERSSKSHSHEFAWLKKAWENLPEHLAEQFPSPEHLRKRALVDAGFFDETIIDTGSNAAAIRVASTVRARSEFAVVFVRGINVIIRDAKSQSRRAMDKKDFQASKNAIMDVIAKLIGVAPEALARHASPPTVPPHARQRERA